MARPPLEIDGVQVEKLATLGCKTTEIAHFFDCSTDTIERRFAAELTKGRASLRISLRRWQLDAARKGNATLLIWLGKQLLEQIESQSVVLSEPQSAKPLDKETILSVVKIIKEGA